MTHLTHTPGPSRMLERALIAALIGVLMAMVVTLTGCASKPPVAQSHAIAGAGASAARADAGLSTVKDLIGQAYESCSDVGQALLDAAQKAAAKAVEDLQATSAQLEKANAERDELLQQMSADRAKLAREIEREQGRTFEQRIRAEKAEANPGYVVWTFCAKWIRITVYVILGGMGVSLVLYLATLFVSGPLKKPISNAAAGIFHLSTGFVVWVIKKIFSWRSAAKAAA